MLQSIKDLHGYKIQAIDGNIGDVNGFYFDDESWNIRYLVIDTGKWLPGRKVLISPVAMGKPDREKNTFLVSLTKEEVENSPGIDSERPVSRQFEKKLREYYEWPIYWSDSAFSPGIPLSVRSKEVATAEAEKEEDLPEEEEVSHLRSTKEVIGYHVQAVDGEIGHVEDFIVDDEDWIIRYMGVNTRNWLPGKKVILSIQWVEKITWKEAKTYVDFTREEIKNSPEYDISEPIHREYEKKLYEHYGKPKYWM